MVLRGRTSKLLFTRICIHVAVAVTVLYVQITHRPKETDTYYTNNPNETNRAGVTYTCGCSLPAYLQSVENSVTSRSLNSCYEFSSLETVTVLMYSHSAAALVPDLHPKISELASSDITYREVGGYTASQQAHDLFGFNFRKPLPSSSVLRDLFLDGYWQEDIFPSVTSLRSADFTTFPRSYLRLTFLIHCDNCSRCGRLENVTDILMNISKTDAWATCFYWGALGDNCKNLTAHNYDAKCLLYPTEALPANFAIQRFLGALEDKLPDITILDTRRRKNTTVFEPSSMYLNISRVESSRVQLSFVEVLKGSALWASLSTFFPTLDNCGASDKDRVQVCDGTSVCNVFTKANSYDLRCLDMNNREQCKKLMGNTSQPPGYSSSTFDNAESFKGNASDIPWLDLECPSFDCQDVFPRYVVWNTSKVMENDALNRFLSSRILNNYWAQRSGVCTNTYNHVVRYNPSTTPGATATDLQGATNDSNHTIFLETMCTRNGTYSTGNGTYCWLTGRYHNISDLPEEPWRDTTDLADELFRVTDRRFVCYKVKDQDLEAWFINVVGILFGWTGTVELLWKGVVVRLVTRLKARREAFRIARVQSALLRGL